MTHKIVNFLVGAFAIVVVVGIYTTIMLESRSHIFTWRYTEPHPDFAGNWICAAAFPIILVPLLIFGPMAIHNLGLNLRRDLLKK